MKLFYSRLASGLASLAVIVSLLALFGGCFRAIQSDFSDADLQSTTNRLAAGDIPAGLKTLEADNSFGPVHVTATDGPTGHWSWKLTVQARTDSSAREWAEASSCVATPNGDTLRLAVSLPRSEGPRRIESALEIQVPKALAVRISNRFGELTIQGVSGDVEAGNENGSVALRELPGRVRAETSFAAMSAERLGPAALKNQNGSIEVRNVNGPLEASTRFASLEARDISGRATLRDENGSIEVENVKGDADLDTSFSRLSARNIEGKARIHNQNGGVEIEHVTGDVEARTSFARLQVEDVSGSAALEDQNGELEALRIQGAVKAETSFAGMNIESAGRTLDCRNQNGSIRLRATSSEVSRVEAETSFAAIELRLPAGLKPTIQAHTTFADVESDFPIVLGRGAADSAQELEAGGAAVRVNNQNGSIRILREHSMAEK
jgi:DUF4097 and DUF4098 domain-containing protein YvlB